MKATTKLMILGIFGVSLILVSVASAADWYVPGSFPTIQAAIDSSSSGDRIFVGPGHHYGATVTKAVEIRGEDGAVINDGPLPWGVPTRKAGFFFSGLGSGSGATISHFRFETVEFPVFSRGANDVTVEHCTLINPIQGVTNWHGQRWQISHNEIIDLQTFNGGGIGILIGGVLKTWQYLITDNVVAHNKIIGVLHVMAGDGGGYNGTGIVLYADFRWGAAGADQIAYNRVVKNKISVVSDTPSVVDVAAIELTDTRGLTGVIYENSIGFNDLRDTVLQIYLTPVGLDNPVNDISRNLGENRGHGLHPSAFGPGED